MRSCVAMFFRAGISVRAVKGHMGLVRLQTEGFRLQIYCRSSHSASARPKGAASTPRSRTDDASAASVRAASAA